MVLHFLEFASAVVLKHVRRTANMVAHLLASVAGFNELPRKPPKSSLIGKKKKKMELDRISNLPTGVSHQILSYLPIKEAVRTSVLSSNWRYKWTKLPCLVFDDKHGCMTKRIVDHVLLLHRSRIETFELSIRIYPGHSYFSYGDIDKWIAHLSRHSIKQFILKIWKNWSPYRIFSRLFSYQDLTHLELHNCLLEVPLTFKSFGMLTSLHLRKVTVSQDVLEKLIVCCPRLNRMILCGLKGITHVNINSPSIQFLKVRGSFENVQLKNTFNLVDVSMHRTKSSRSSRKLLKLLFKLPRLERLTLADRFLQCGTGSLPGKLAPCLCLNFLSISICVNRLKEIFTTVCLLRRSPALQELEISIRQDDEANAAGAPYFLNENQEWEFTQLRRVKLISLSGVKAEVDMIKFLLLHSPALQELEISFDQEDAKEVNFSGLDDNQNCAIAQLQLVKVTGVSGVKAEVDFIRYLISSSSPMLIERMILQPASAVVYWELFKLLPEFHRDSVHVDLKVLDPSSSSPVQDSDHGSSSDSDDSFSDSDDDMFY